MIKSQVPKPDMFLWDHYFAYGANIFTFRMHMHTPAAQFVSIARADNYRLDFIHYHKFWGGPEATMVPTANAHVWGVIWKVHREDLPSLNDIKGINHDKYYIKYIPVLTPYMGYFTCRAYLQKVNPLPRGDRDYLPVEYWPSWTYQQVMIMGAKEHKLPPYYTELLVNMPNNGEEGCLRVACLLNRYARDPICECKVPGRIPRIPLKLDRTYIVAKTVELMHKWKTDIPLNNTK